MPIAPNIMASYTKQTNVEAQAHVVLCGVLYEVDVKLILFRTDYHRTQSL